MFDLSQTPLNTFLDPYISKFNDNFNNLFFENDFPV